MTHTNSFRLSTYRFLSDCSYSGAPKVTYNLRVNALPPHHRENHYSTSTNHQNSKMTPTTPRAEYSPHKRTRIVTAYDLGMSAPTISIKEGVSPGVIYGIVRRYRIQKSAKSSPRVDRPPSLNSRDKRHIFQLIRDSPSISNQDLLNQAGLGCSVTTLTRFLQSEGIQHTKALRRPKLTPEIAKKTPRICRKVFS